MRPLLLSPLTLSLALCVRVSGVCGLCTICFGAGVIGRVFIIKKSGRFSFTAGDWICKQIAQSCLKMPFDTGDSQKDRHVDRR
ncbi:unnamed protein product [Heligmosomoides polygyrus]|uniref:Secreted protein n=1 Tax=Heligmosomoides polygyrus TaxID=6339 RepID=A0A183G4W0_HELPZ|nr:unnamed protein product [Heligmosomoides polygyrus]